MTPDLLQEYGIYGIVEFWLCPNAKILVLPTKEINMLRGALFPERTSHLEIQGRLKRVVSMMSSIFELLGHADNLGEPEPILNERSTIYGLLISSLVLSSLFVAGRIWIRLVITHSPGLDDVFVILAVLCNTTLVVSLCIAVDYGLGKHFIPLGLEGMQQLIRRFYVVTGTYPLSSTSIKLALLFQYLRLFEKGSKSRKTTFVVIGAVCIWGLAFGFLAWVPCIPVRAFWNWTIHDTQTRRYGYSSEDQTAIVAIYVANAASNMILDLAILAIPMPSWKEKNMQGKTRIALSGVFVLGAMYVHILPTFMHPFLQWTFLTTVLA